MNEDKLITQTIAQKTLKLFLGCLILILIILALFYCNSKPHPFIKPDTTNQAIAINYNQIDSINQINTNLNAKIDSLSNLKPKVIVRYKTVYDSLLIIDTMCVRSLITLHDEHSKIDSVNNHIITNQSKVIQNDSNIITNYKQISSNYKIIHINDSIRNKQLTDTIPTVKRKGYIKGFIHGFGSGASVIKGVEVITNLR